MEKLIQIWVHEADVQEILDFVAQLKIDRKQQPSAQQMKIESGMTPAEREKWRRIKRQ